MMCFTARRRVRRLLAERIAEPERAALALHLRECAACRAEHDRAVGLLRAIAGRTPTAAEGRATWARLTARLEAELLPRPQVPGAISRDRREARRWAGLRWRAEWAPALLASAALLLLGLSVSLRGALPVSGPDRQTRGTEQGPVLLDVEIYAMREAQAAPRRLRDGDAVGLDENLQFRYRNHSLRLRYLYLLGLDERLEPLDYFPRPTDEVSLQIDEALGPRAIPSSIRLGRRHQAGSLWVVGLFSERALSRTEVHGLIERLRFRGTDEAGLYKIDLGPDIHPVVRRLTLTGVHP